MPNYTNNSSFTDISVLLSDADKDTQEFHIGNSHITNTWNETCAFLEANKLVMGNNLTQEYVGLESFRSDSNLQNIGETGILSLVRAAKIPTNMEGEATKAVAVLLAKFKASKSARTFMTQHFDQGNRSKEDASKFSTSLQQAYAPSLQGLLTNFGVPSREAFGADIDKVLPDIRASLTITLLQFHRNLLDRIMHRRTSASPYVKYVVPYSEVYDALKANSASSEERNHGEHIVPFIELYGDARPVTPDLKLIVPLMAQDKNGVLAADGIIVFGREANIFNLSMIPNQPGYTHVNYTDLVSENVLLDSVYVKVSNAGGDTEIFQLETRGINGYRFNMLPNVADSGIRGTIVQHPFKLSNTSTTISNIPTTLLAACTATDYVRINVHAASQINLKTADVSGIGSLTASAYNINKAAVDPAVAAAVAGLTFELFGYTLDARFSEENLRKSSISVRTNTRTFDFEIANGRNTIVDSAMTQEVPEFLLSTASETTSIGMDARAIDVIVSTMMHVYDVTAQENADPGFKRKLDKIGFQYVASQMTRPVVYISTIDLNDVDTIRSGDIMGDVRTHVEWQLLNLTSLFFQNSFYRHQLSNGEKPVFKVVTSSIILDNLFSIPHYHNHLDSSEPTDGTNVELRHVLPNGTILDCVSVTFNNMRDRIIMIPYRDNAPDCVLNWGHNWDYGTFIANYNPQDGHNAVNKRVFSNTRAQPIPTNPSGLYLTVKNISRIVNMNQITNPTNSALPDFTPVP